MSFDARTLFESVKNEHIREGLSHATADAIANGVILAYLNLAMNGHASAVQNEYDSRVNDEVA